MPLSRSEQDVDEKTVNETEDNKIKPGPELKRIKFHRHVLKKASCPKEGNRPLILLAN